MKSSLRRTVITVALLNLGYFGVEFGVALVIGSVSLFADSVDFLEDTSINLLIAVALGWSATNRARLGMALAGILLIPSLSTVWTAWQKFLLPIPPAAIPLTLVGLGSLVVNLSCAFMLARFRAHSGSLTRAAFFSARNDAVANVNYCRWIYYSSHEVRLAGFDCRSWNFDYQCRRSTEGVACSS
jgi:Co/Zn/Cd efflux system component